MINRAAASVKPIRINGADFDKSGIKRAAFSELRKAAERLFVNHNGLCFGNDSFFDGIGEFLHAAGAE